MKLLMVLTGLLLSISSYADQPKHQLTFGSNYDTKWYGKSFTADVGSPLDSWEGLDGNLSLAYAYRLTDKFQLGGAFSSRNREEEYEFRNGTKVETDDSSFSIFAIATYNFSFVLKQAWYLAVAVGREVYETKLTDSFGSSDDADYNLNVFSLIIGKRFSLEKWGLQNLSYSPMITFSGASVDGDLQDEGADTVSTTTLDLIKFDLLF